MGFITKSIRLDVGSPLVKEFLDTQTNFSKAIKFLIFDYCSKNGIEDLAQKYNAVSEEAVLNQMIQNSQNPLPTITQNMEQEVETKTEIAPTPLPEKESEIPVVPTVKPEAKSEGKKVSKYSEYED